MSKKKTGMLIALGAALGGAAAAGISYYLKYKSFNDEVDKDFHDYEDEDLFDEETDASASDAASCEVNRTYITLDSGKAASAEEAPAKKEEADSNATPEAAANEGTPEITIEEDTESVNE